MVKRLVLPLAVILVLLAPLVIGHAQDNTPTTQINAALADLSRRANGETITLDDMTQWSWNQAAYPDTSLGCPQPGQSYAQVTTTGYQLVFVLRGARFDYRASADGSILFLCSGPATVPPAPAVAATRTPAPNATPAPAVTAAGRQVCSGAMNTRLNVGMTGQVRPTGLAVNVRSAAGANNAAVGRLLPGEQFTIIGGPQCANNLVWWEITSETFNGWVGEGQNGVYWLEPVSDGTTTTGRTPVPNIQTPATTPVPGAATPAALITPGAAVVYDISAGTQPITADNAEALAQFVDLPLNEPVTGLDWSADGQWLAASAPNGIWLYNMTAVRAAPRLLQVPNGPTYAVAFAPEGSFMATAHHDGTVRVWDIMTGGQRAILRGHTGPVLAVAFSPDGTRVASGSEDMTIRLWDINTRTQLTLLEGHTAPVTALAFSPDGTLLASGSEDNGVRLWDMVSGTAATALNAHTAPVRAVVFSPDGTRLASAGDDQTVRLWNISSAESTPLQGHTAPVLALAFSPDGAILASAGGSVEEPGDPAVRLWDTETGEAITAFTQYGGTPDTLITGLVFNANGSLIGFATVQDTTSTIRLWGGR